MDKIGIPQVETTKRFSTRSPKTLLCGLFLAFFLSGCAGLPENSGRERSRVIDDGVDTRLGGHFKDPIAANPGKNGVRILRYGPDAFVARAVLARLAERSIDAQYYLWQQDTVGRLLIREMIDAADRGVRVRLLIDDMYGDGGQDTWLAMDVHPQIEVRLFNPFSRGQPRATQFLTNLEDVNYRMHSKSYNVDNQVAIVGGRNIGDEYFDASTDLVFVDRDALVVGPAVPQVSGEFDEYWNSEHAYPVTTLLPAASDAELQALRDQFGAFLDGSSTASYLQALDESGLAGELRAGTVELLWGPGKIIRDSSEKKEHDEDWRQELVISQLAPYITGSTEEVIIVSPYFVPGKKATQALCELARNTGCA